MPTFAPNRAMGPALAISAVLMAPLMALACLAAAAPAQAQSPAQSHGRHSYGPPPVRDARVVVTYGQPTAYDYDYSYGRTGVGAPNWEARARTYAATGAAATGHDDRGRRYDRPYRPDRFAYLYRPRHDTLPPGYAHDRGGRYGYSPQPRARTWQGYRDDHGYQDDRPRGSVRYEQRREYRYERRSSRRECDCEPYLYDR